MSNQSYIDDSDNFSELWEFLEKKHIYSLLAPTDEDLEDHDDPLNQDQSNRLIRALNWGREQVDSIIREKYDVSSLTPVEATNILKDWNARYAQWTLERRRYRSGEATTEDKKEIDDEIILYAREVTPHSLTLPRKPSPIRVAADSHATAFDYGGQFHIPNRERNDLWPDGLNE